MQNEISEKKPLLNEDGSLSECGFSREMLLQYDRTKITASRFRIKEWDYYLINNEDYAVALTIADNSYMGLVSISLMDFRTKTETTKTKIFMFPMGKLEMPSSSRIGNIEIAEKDYYFAFEKEKGRRTLTVEMDKFNAEGETIKGEFFLTDEPRDSMVIATPFPKKKNAFYYNQKVIGMRASGVLELGEETLSFSSRDTMALLDWGRGVWTYDNTWYWGAAQGFVDGIPVGFNLGYGFGDTAAATENAVFFNGAMHKLDGVTFHIPKVEEDYDDLDFLSPWNITSNDSRFEMVFQPILDRASLTSLLFLLSDQHQIFGRYTGKAVLDNGRVIDFDNFLGFAEKVRNKW